MAGYKEIKGFHVQTRSEDPVPYAQALEDNPYAGTWSSGGSLNTAKVGGSSGGTQTALVFAGGYDGSGATNTSETYNGTAFTEGNNLNTGRTGLGNGLGTATAQLAVGGVPNSVLVESYNGTSWTEITEINTGRSELASSGTSTAGLATGGTTGSVSALTELWNGSAWTEVNDLNTARRQTSASGTSTASFLVSGETPPNNFKALVESWNGSSWTETTDLNDARANARTSGTTSAMLAYGGNTPPFTGNTESWDGSSWTEVADLATARAGSSSTPSGSSISALAAGGSSPAGPGVDTSTEEWSFTGLPPSTPAEGYANAIVGDFYYNSSTGQFKNIAQGVGSWSSGGNMNSTKGSHSGFGASKDSALAGGGAESPSPPPAGVNTEIYNGTTWTEVNNLSTGTQMSGSFGTVTAGIFASGSDSTGAAIANNQSWDGTNWTEVGDVNTARRQGKGAGTTTAGIIMGGISPPYRAQTETWNGSAWTETNDLNQARAALGSSISSPYTSVVVFAGQNPPVGAALGLTETWNGSSWTETTDMNTARNNIGGSGTSSTSALAYFGQPPPSQTTITESWDGTSWTEVADGATPRAYVGSAGTASSAQINGGEKSGASPYYRAETEEFDKPDFNIKTVTTS
jgi:hypothetical protein